MENILNKFEYTGYNNNMATISMFYGILIRMYMGKKEHNPPHIHAIYQSKKAIFDIKTGERTEGNLPNDKEKLVSAWIILHKENYWLIGNWPKMVNSHIILTH